MAFASGNFGTTPRGDQSRRGSLPMGTHTSLGNYYPGCCPEEAYGDAEGVGLGGLSLKKIGKSLSKTVKSVAKIATVVPRAATSTTKALLKGDVKGALKAPIRVAKDTTKEASALAMRGVRSVSTAAGDVAKTTLKVTTAPTRGVFRLGRKVVGGTPGKILGKAESTVASLPTRAEGAVEVGIRAAGVVATGSLLTSNKDKDWLLKGGAEQQMRQSGALPGEVRKYGEPAVGVVLGALSFFPPTAPFALPASLAWSAATATRSIVLAKRAAKKQEAEVNAAIDSAYQQYLKDSEAKGAPAVDAATFRNMALTGDFSYLEGWLRGQAGDAPMDQVMDKAAQDTAAQKKGFGIAAAIAIAIPFLGSMKA